jgi:hypothetical protein
MLASAMATTAANRGEDHADSPVYDLRRNIPFGQQLHEGLRKLSLRPPINFSPEDFDELTNFG